MDLKAEEKTLSEKPEERYDEAKSTVRLTYIKSIDYDTAPHPIAVTLSPF